MIYDQKSKSARKSASNFCRIEGVPWKRSQVGMPTSFMSKLNIIDMIEATVVAGAPKSGSISCKISF